jgi:hypothetical protein
VGGIGQTQLARGVLVRLGAATQETSPDAGVGDGHAGQSVRRPPRPSENQRHPLLSSMSPSLSTVAPQEAHTASCSLSLGSAGARWTVGTIGVSLYSRKPWTATARHPGRKTRLAVNAESNESQDALAVLRPERAGDGSRCQSDSSSSEDCQSTRARATPMGAP